MNRFTTLVLSLGLFASVLQGIAANTYHQWTDVKGRTITAAFVKADGATITVRLKGKLANIPIADLSPESRVMLGKLFTADKDTPGPDRNAFLDWTDKTGRTIRAKLVKTDVENLTVELEGALYALTLAQLSPETQKLVQTLAGPTKEPVPQPEPGKDEPQEWKDVNGRHIQARFVKLAGETLTIEMNGQNFDLPIDRLSPDSQALARRLAGNVKPSPDKTPQEKPVDEKIAKAMENGPPDQAEITLALNQAVEYFRTLGAKDEEGLFYPPIRKRKVIGHVDKTVTYRKIVVQIPVFEWTTTTKEVIQNVKVGDSGAVTVKKKVKVPVRVRGKQTGTRPQNRLVRDKNGTVEKIHKIPQYGPGGTVEWKSGQLGQNALVVYALIKSGVDPFDELVTRPLESFSYLYNTFGLPDSSWDLAWSICAFASSEQEDHRKLASEMAAKLAGAQVKSGPAAGLWGPVGLDTELLGSILSANADTGAEYLRFKKKFDENKKEYDENKMKEALELVRRTNNLKSRYTMTAKENSYYFRVALKDEGFSETAGQVFNFIAFPLYLYNQTTVDLETTAVVLHALSVASSEGALPKETTTLRPKGSRQTLGKPRSLSQVLASAMSAIAKGQSKDGSFHQLNFHQPVNDFDKSLLIQGVPADPTTFPKLESPRSIAATAQGLSAFNAIGTIAGEQAASRYARNLQAATARVKEDLPTALFVDPKQTTASSTFGPYDFALAFSIPNSKQELRTWRDQKGNGIRGILKKLQGDRIVMEKDGRDYRFPLSILSEEDQENVREWASQGAQSAKLAIPLVRFLVDGQGKDGAWRPTSRSKSLISSSMRTRSTMLPEYTGRGFDWAQAWVLPAKWNNSYYPTPAGIVPTSYAMLALSNAMEYALEPEVDESPDDTPPAETQNQPGTPPDPKLNPQPE
tara:strand:- start:920 stop:3673 length:2754 start_codon:yes stop_codon:yes gene_type:complete